VLLGLNMRKFTAVRERNPITGKPIPVSVSRPAPIALTDLAPVDPTTKATPTRLLQKYTSQGARVSVFELSGTVRPKARAPEAAQKRVVVMKRSSRLRTCPSEAHKVTFNRDEEMAAPPRQLQ